MKKSAFVFCMAAALLMAGCGQKETEAQDETVREETVQEETVQEEAVPEETAGGEAAAMQVANPFVTCDTLDEAEKQAGFPVSMPEKVPNWMNHMVYRAIPGELLEIILEGTGEEEIRIRKAPGSEDISGDYNSYALTEEVDQNGKKMTLKGGEDGFSLAVWQDGEYTYAFSAEPAMDKEHFLSMAEDVE